MNCVVHDTAVVDPTRRAAAAAAAQDQGGCWCRLGAWRSGSREITVLRAATRPARRGGRGGGDGWAPSPLSDDFELAFGREGEEGADLSEDVNWS